MSGAERRWPCSIVQVRVQRVVATVFLAAASAIGLLTYYVNHEMRLRIVSDGRSALMAVDSEGLRQLNSLYALPGICADAAFRARTDPGTWLKLCLRGVPVTSETTRKGMVLLPAGTRAISLDTRYVLPGGQFAVSYSAPNINAMIRDGVVEVEHIKITQQPNKNLEG